MQVDRSIKALSPAALLGAWETGVQRQPLDRGLALLWYVGAVKEPADLPLLEYERLLLGLRRATFGFGMSAVTSCPGCAAELEVELDSEVLEAALPDAASDTFELDGQCVNLRALTCRDLAAALLAPASESAGILRQRATGLSDIGGALAAEVDARLEAQAAQGELELKLVCTECGAGWTEILDVLDYVWREVDLAARRLMGEVAEIAAAFGWAEHDILALNPVRRRTYLELARGG